MQVFDMVGSVREGVSKIEGIQHKPPGGVKRFGSRTSYALSLAVKEKEILVYIEVSQMTQNTGNFLESSQHQAATGKPVKLIAILGGAASLCFVVVFVICCGAGIWMTNFGVSIATSDIERQLRDHPQIRRSVGEIENLEVNWGHSLAHEDESTFIYDVIGSKGRGQLTIESVSNSDGSEKIVSAELRRSDGEIVELALE